MDVVSVGLCEAESVAATKVKSRRTSSAESACTKSAAIWRSPRHRVARNLTFIPTPAYPLYINRTDQQWTPLYHWWLITVLAYVRSASRPFVALTSLCIQFVKVGYAGYNFPEHGASGRSQ